MFIASCLIYISDVNMTIMSRMLFTPFRINFLAAKGAAQEGQMCGVSHTYANVIFIQFAKV